MFSEETGHFASLPFRPLHNWIAKYSANDTANPPY